MQLTESQITAARELAEIRDAKRALETKEKLLRTQLIHDLEQAGDTQGFTASGQVAITIRTSTRSGINKSKLEALFPDVFEQCKTETIVKSLLLP